MKFNPSQGPWRVKEHGVIVGGKDVRFARGSAQLQIAMVCTVDEGNGNRDHNARLMAGSLELYESMRELFGADMERCMLGDGKDDQIAAIERAKRALAAIEGDCS